jgi:hypothetical protein
MAASKSARPATFVTDSVVMGCTAHRAAAKKAGSLWRNNRNASANTSPYVHQMEQEIQSVISGGVVSLAQNAVVQQIGEGGDGTIQTVGRTWPPVMFAQNESDILSGGGLDAEIADYGSAIARKSQAKGIRPGDENERGQSEMEF